MGKKKAQKSNDDYLASLEEEEEVVTTTTKPKQNKKNAKKKSATDDYLSLLQEDEESSNIPSTSDSNEVDDDDLPQSIKPASKKQQKKNNKKNNKGSDADYLSQLQDEVSEASVEAQPPKQQQQQSKQSKKKKPAADDYLSQLDQEDEAVEESTPPPQPKQQPKQQQQSKKKKPTTDDYLAQLDQEDTTAEETPAPATEEQPKEEAKGGSKKQQQKKDNKKNDNKKKDEKKKDDKKKDDKKKDDKKKAPAKPVNARIAALREQMQKKKEEEERMRIEEEERIKREEEAMRLFEEQKKKDDLERKEKAKIRRAEEKKQKQQREKEEKERRAKEAIEAFRRQGMIVPGLGDKAPVNTEAPPQKTEKAEPKQTKKTSEKPKPKPKAEPKKQDADDSAVDDWEDLLLEDEKDEGDENVDEEEETQEEEREEENDAQEDEEVTRKKNTSKEELRSPVCCVLGHVDTGKTKLLDKIRNTNVQSGEAGGITQQIGATYVPIDAIKRQTKKLNEMTKGKLQYNLPGLLIIDTPGHESFTNLRSRGSSLCDIAILVVDILHGLERQTLESLQLLRQRKTPFVVALNKIDTIYGWKATPNAPIKEALKNQPKHTMEQFDENVKKTIYLFNEQGFNAELYYKNKDVQNYISLVPTSAITGEGLPDLLALMCQLTQKHMVKKITLQSKFQCTILEVKVVDGYGTTIDVILSNGLIREGDKIVLCTLNGPVATTIRALLTPQPMRELRVKSEYMHHKEIRASMGIKISAPDLEGAVPGSQVFLVKPDDDIEELKEEVMGDLNDMLARISKSGKGVCVQSSTLGSLEALLEFLHSENIPVSGINIGPVHKRDIVRTSVMLDHHPEYAVLLAFDVPVSKEAEHEAAKTGVTIFKADIIYHLFDQFIAHQKKVREAKIHQTEKEVVWPCILKISEQNVFRKKDPITLGVDVVEGVLRVGTPLIVPTRDNLTIGRVIGIQHQKVAIKEAERGRSVAIQIDSGKLVYDRHFDHTDLLYSKISRESIDLLKQLFPDELKNNHDLLVLLVKLKKLFKIQ